MVDFKVVTYQYYTEWWAQEGDLILCINCYPEMDTGPDLKHVVMETMKSPPI